MRTEKECTGCKITKPIDEFYKSKRDGCVSKCKECLSKYDRDRAPERAIYYKRYRDKNRQKIKDYKKKYREENKDKIINHMYLPEQIIHRKAMGKVHYAMHKGRLLRPNICSKCQKECKPDAHHEDYSKPLDIVWLCKPCHAIRHLELKELKLNG